MREIGVVLMARILRVPEACRLEDDIMTARLKFTEIDLKWRKMRGTSRRNAAASRIGREPLFL